jgi:hypothetical protein
VSPQRPVASTLAPGRRSPAELSAGQGQEARKAVQTPSKRYLDDGLRGFTNVMSTHLPKIKASIGDLEFGDGDSDLVLAEWGQERQLFIETPVLVFR